MREEGRAQREIEKAMQDAEAEEAYRYKKQLKLQERNGKITGGSKNRIAELGTEFVAGWIKVNKEHYPTKTNKVIFILFRT